MSGPLLSVDFVGKNDVQNYLRKASGVVDKAMAAGLYQLGCAVISDSIPRAPKDTGTLRNSAYCELPKGAGKETSVTGGYGGFAKAYALVQHENTAYRHTEGSSHFLQKAFDKFAPQAQSFLADIMARAIQSGNPPPMNSRGVSVAPGGKVGGSSRKKGGGNKGGAKRKPGGGRRRRK